MMVVLVRGGGRLGPAVAQRLFEAGYGVVLHDGPASSGAPGASPAETPRAKGAPAGSRTESAPLIPVDRAAAAREIFAGRRGIAVAGGSIDALVDELRPEIIVDTRHQQDGASSERRGRFTIGVGPGFVAGRDVDVAIPTPEPDRRQHRGSRETRERRGSVAADRRGDPDERTAESVFMAVHTWVSSEAAL